MKTTKELLDTINDPKNRYFDNADLPFDQQLEPLPMEIVIE
jgi:hypothetical protein